MTGYGLLNVSHGSKSRVCASEAVIDSFRNHPARQQGDELNNLDIESVFESRIVVESAIARRCAAHR